MEEMRELRLRLHGLTVFRALLEDPVIARLDALLAAVPAGADGSIGAGSSANAANPSDAASAGYAGNTMDPAAVVRAVDAYCAFAAALYEAGGDWSSYLLDAVLRSENLHVRRVAAGTPPTEELTEALHWELRFLQRLSAFDGAALRAALGGAGTLPRWRTQPLDFRARYEEHLRTLGRHGYGIYAQYSVFTVRDGALVPVKHPDIQPLDTLSGYERERGLVIANTRALLEGRPASNVLLYGDAGTGKSSTIKAVAGAFAQDGLRLVEVKKNQLYQIPELVGTLCANPLKFILFIDDLSFSANDDDFAALKAILEGSVGGRGANVAVYATSNRRHLVKETFSDRTGDEIHLADTVQELMSLSARFGLTITFTRPDKELYCHIVRQLALLYDIDLSETELLTRAEAYAIRSGGRTPRAARQFVELLKAEVMQGGGGAAL